MLRSGFYLNEKPLILITFFLSGSVALCESIVIFNYFAAAKKYGLEKHDIITLF